MVAAGASVFQAPAAQTCDEQAGQVMHLSGTYVAAPTVVKKKFPADIPATRALATIYNAVSKATVALPGNDSRYADGPAMHTAAAGKDTVKHAEIQQIEGFDTLKNVTGTGDNKELHTSANVELAIQADRLDAATDIGLDVPGVGQNSNDQGKAKDQQVTKLAFKATDANREGQEIDKGDLVRGDRGSGECSNLGAAVTLKIDRATAGVMKPTTAHADLIEKASSLLYFFL